MSNQGYNKRSNKDYRGGKQALPVFSPQKYRIAMEKFQNEQLEKYTQIDHLEKLFENFPMFLLETETDIETLKKFVNLMRDRITHWRSRN